MTSSNADARALKPLKGGKFIPQSEMALAEVADRHFLQLSSVAPRRLCQLLYGDLLTTKERIDQKGNVVAIPLIEMAPFLAASRDSKEVAGSHAACATVSGNCGKFVPGVAGRLLTMRGFRDQTQAELPGSYDHQLN